MSQKELVCPQCGRRFVALANVRFCDFDGTKLEALPAPADPSPVAPITKTSLLEGDTFTKVFIGTTVVVGVGLLLVAGYVWLGENDSSSRRDMSGRFSSVSEALKTCYGGTLPEPPKNVSTALGQSFERAKEQARKLAAVIPQAAGAVVSPDEERKFGKEALDAIRSEFPDPSSTAIVSRVEKIVGNLALKAPRSSELDYRSTLLGGDTVNAAMLPGGFMIVWEKLATIMESDDSLAYVLGHEIAHAELQHHLPALKMAKAGEKMGYDMVGILGEKLGRKLGFGAASLLSSVYDQDQEFAADRLGLCLARVAGYSASGGKAAMDILNRNSARPDGATEKQKKGESVDSNARVFYDIMNTHPPAKERSEYLSTLAGALKI